MGVGDRELDADESAGDEAAQELAPEGLGLALAELDSVQRDS